MALSKKLSEIGDCYVPDWKPPCVGKPSSTFKTFYEKFAYNNFSHQEVMQHSTLLAKCEAVTLVEVNLPFGTFLVSHRTKDLGFYRPSSVTLFKSDRATRSFITTQSELSSKTVLSKGKIHVDAFTFTEGCVGATWDKRCLGIAISFAPIHWRNDYTKVTPMTGRNPYTSYMERHPSLTCQDRKLRPRTRIGMPISTTFSTNVFYHAFGNYMGVGFGADLTGIEKFNKAFSDSIAGQYKGTPSAYAKLVEKYAPFVGSIANCASIAYVAGVSFSDANPSRVMIFGTWGYLLREVLDNNGIPTRMDRGIMHHWFVDGGDLDDACGTHPFCLVECLEDVVGFVGDVVERVQLPNGTVMEVGNDTGLFVRNRVIVRLR